jgi:3-hydroxyacyl-CoA dehydrogenase
LLRKIIGKHRIIASETSNIIMNEVNNIIFEQSEKTSLCLHFLSVEKFVLTKVPSLAPSKTATKRLLFFTWCE